MGAHPDEPSLLPDGRPLNEAITSDPEALLGPAAVERFGPRLPYRGPRSLPGSTNLA